MDIVVCGDVFSLSGVFSLNLQDHMTRGSGNFKASHHPAKFVANRHCDSGDIMVCLVGTVINGSCDFMSRSPFR